MAGINKDDVDLHFNTNKFNDDDHAKQISFFYKALYQINDIVLGIIFLVGSFFFFSDSTMVAGTVLFVIGSLQMTARPVISFIHDLKLSKYYKQKYRELSKEINSK
ncbi:YrhK family protein [Staphylococcus taiwanensis]|nr:YrhK family protein [Staphylococcus taiwanensis]